MPGNFISHNTCQDISFQYFIQLARKSHISLHLPGYFIGIFHSACQKISYLIKLVRKFHLNIFIQIARKSHISLILPGYFISHYSCQDISFRYFIQIARISHISLHLPGNFIEIFHSAFQDISHLITLVMKFHLNISFSLPGYFIFH
jgi:hypothetical protein